jgi:hypothetical protein
VTTVTITETITTFSPTLDTYVPEVIVTTVTVPTDITIYETVVYISTIVTYWDTVFETTVYYTTWYSTEVVYIPTYWKPQTTTVTVTATTYHW